MSIRVYLVPDAGFLHAANRRLVGANTSQNQTFQNFEIQNGYGTATTVSVSPGYGATVNAQIDIQVDTVSEQTFNQIINEVKNSSSYQNNSSFKQFVDQSSYSAAAHVSTGIFGWLIGGGGASYNNSHSNITNQINQYNSGSASDDHTVANTVASIMVKNQSKVHVTANVSVTGQLLVPSPTVIAVETTTFKFQTATGNTSSVTMLNQTPLVPVDASNNTVSQNTIAPGSKLTLSPIS
ncbi:MAG: hypothetical protein KDA88_22890 [Planctomycetaceae bacterium]|nr:hypothetical protein [Planctomycetaceae bacterium]